jgi:hypothetical protein
MRSGSDSKNIADTMNLMLPRNVFDAVGYLGNGTVILWALL